MYKYIKILAILALAFLQKETPTVVDADHSVAVQVAAVQVQSMVSEIKGAGLLASTTEARLSFKTGGVIQKIYVDEGDRVRKGQLLASLNLTEINLQVAQAEEGLAKAQRDYDRVQRLYKDSVATLEQAQNVATALNLAKNSFDIAKYNQGYSTIVAPADGVVVKQLMNEGEIVAPGTPLFFVNATGEGDWVLKIGVADKDWARVQEGNSATVYLDAYPEIVFDGKVKTLSQGADISTGSYQIEVQVSPKGQRLATGLFGKAVIKNAKARDFHLVPAESIVEGQGQEAFVFVPNGNKAKKVPVKVSQIIEGKALVSQGLEGVQQVITSGAGFLTEHSTITVK